MTDDDRGSSEPSESRTTTGQFAKGVSGNPGGRPRKLIALEAALDEHRTAENLREVLSLLRKSALSGEAGAMKLYLDRIFGPAKEVGYFVALEDIANAPTEVLEYFASGMKGKQ